MEQRSRSFLRTWGLTCVVLTVIGASINIVMDPYLLFGLPRIGGFNGRKPAIRTQERLLKAYDVLRAEPRTLLLGSSRVDRGLDGRNSGWPAADRPVYNLGIGGGGPYIAYRYLQHVMSRHPPGLVVLGLDFEYVLMGSATEHSGTGEFETRLAVERDGRINPAWRWQYARDLVQSAFSLNALADSAATLVANLKSESLDVVAGNADTSADLSRFVSELGSYPAATYSNLISIRQFKDKQPDRLVMEDVRAIADLCVMHGTRLILFINPVHVDRLEILDLLGVWGDFEDWKRELVALTVRYPDRDGQHRVLLWDFSDYDAYSTEPVPHDRHVMYWFWDSYHYTRPLGDRVIGRMFSGGDENFGTLLTAENLESHLATVRERKRLYRVTHTTEARHMRDLYESVTHAPPAGLVTLR